jgi:hypothetical protein
MLPVPSRKCPLADLPAPVELLNDIHTAFRASVLGFHRVQHDAPIRMHAYPVIGKYCVRCVRLLRIANDDHLYACIAQCSRQGVKLAKRSILLFCGRQRGLALETIRCCGKRIAFEPGRPNHHYR